MLLSVLAMLPASAKELSELQIQRKYPNNTNTQKQVASFRGTPEVDGQIDAIWADAHVAKLEHVIAGDSRDASATSSNSVQFRTMWDDDRVYLLIEIQDDELTPDNYDAYSDNRWWRNDAIYIYVSETGHHTGYSAGKSYQIALPLLADKGEEILFINGGYGITDAEYGITTPAMTRKTVYNGNSAVIEMSWAIQETTLIAHQNGPDGKLSESMVWALDVQYHDVDASSTYAQEFQSDNGKNPRTICTNWASDSSPSSNKNSWGRIKLTTEYEVLKGTPVVDGEIDDMWNSVSASKLDHIVDLSSESRNPQLTDSCSVYAKTLYDDDKVYFIFVIEDDDLKSYVNNGSDEDASWVEYKDDGILVILAEQDYYTNTSANCAATNLCEIYAYPSDKGAYVRSGRGNEMAIEHSYSVTGSTDEGYKMVIEIAVELNVIENEVGNYFYVDYQYNDANPAYPLTENTRDVIRNWMSGDQGTLNNRVLAKMVMSENEAEVEEDEPAIEESLKGEYVLQGESGNDMRFFFDNGMLRIQDNRNPRLAPKIYTDRYTYSGTYETGIVVKDLAGVETDIMISLGMDRVTPMVQVMGYMMPQPLVDAAIADRAFELTLGENVVEVTNGFNGVKASFKAPKAGKYTFAPANGETNLVIMVETEFGADTLELPYTVELAKGEEFKVIVLTDNFEPDTVELVISEEVDNSKTGDATTALLIVSAVALLGTALVVGKKRRVQE